MNRRELLWSGAGLAGAALGIRSIGIGLAAAQPVGAVRVAGAYSAPGLAYAALFIANRKNIWAKQGLEPSLKHVEGGMLAMVTLNSGDSDFICVASTDAMVAWERGIPLRVVAAFYGSLTLQLTARNEWMEKVGVFPTSSIEHKVKALKGARIGSATVGGGPPQYTKYLASLYGLDPERDIRVTMVGQGPTRIAALREGRVDMVVGGSPEADQVLLAGFGNLFINFAEIPAFKEFPFTVVAVREELVAKEPDRVRRVAQTIGQANDFIVKEFDEAISVLHAQFPGIDSRAIQLAMSRDRAAIAFGGRMTQSMWENGAKCAAAMKSIRNMPPLKEGEFWTNEFLA